MKVKDTIAVLLFSPLGRLSREEAKILDDKNPPPPPIYVYPGVSKWTADEHWIDFTTETGRRVTSNLKYLVVQEFDEDTNA